MIYGSVDVSLSLSWLQIFHLWLALGHSFMSGQPTNDVHFVRGENTWMSRERAANRLLMSQDLH